MSAPPADPPAEANDIPEPDVDEFPSEQTRIDPGYGHMQKPAARAPSMTLEALAAAQNQARSPTPAPAPPKKLPTREVVAPPEDSAQRSKLAALQSLSMSSNTAPIRVDSSPRGQQGGSKLPWVLLCLVLAGVGGNWWWQRTHHAGGNGDGTATVIHTERVLSTGGTAQTHVAAGFTAARTPIAVGTAVGGSIKDVKVQNGDKVKRGQIIVDLDSSAAIAELSAVRAEVSDAERALKLNENLFNAQAATFVDVSKARGVLMVARGKLHSPQAKIDQAKIRAPNDATVLEVLVHAGEAVAPNAPVIKIADLHELVAEVDINEGDLVKIRRGQAVDVTSDAFPDAVYKGSVREIAEQADRSRGTVQVKVDMQVPDQTLRPGMSVKCTFQPVKGEKPRVYVSRSAVNAQGSVWLVGADRRVSAKPVKTGVLQGPTIEIVSGLVGGEEIVSDALLVHDGQQIPVPQ